MASSNNQQAVLYRKWRPQKFDDLVGQKPIVKTLQNSISTNQISHAYLFSGPRGTGKTTAGRIFAATVNCKNENNDCVDSFFDGSAMSLIELDAASNRGIDEIRNLKENIAYMVGTNQYKVYLIDEVHMLTDAAFNALLKTLEEPPSHVIFILATTEPHKIPATVLSRCQRYDFKKINNADASLRLIEIAKAESILITDEAIAFIARLSTGSLRDSINMLEQVSILIDDEINIENIMPALGVHIDNRCVPLLENMIKKDLSACLSIILELYNDGIDFKSFKNQIIETLRSALYSWNDNDLIEESFLKDNDLEILKIVCKNNIDEITILMKKISLINFSFDNFHPFPLEILVADLCSNNLNNISNSIPSEPTPVSEAPSEPTPVSEAPSEPTPVSEAPSEPT
ncbi:MAG: DNA polymerase-3 subunit gamma/tau, partial [Chloroflexi bacterium]